MVVGTRKVMVLVVLMVAVVVMSGSEAVELCSMNQEGLDECKPSVTEPPANPTVKCCKALSGADLTCLCSYKNSMLLPTLGINPKLAMELPAKCKLTPPPNC
ncbi:hypothetical protein LguiB_030896 [Lonicera macranthoides]